jgi:hypothetical protein
VSFGAACTEMFGQRKRLNPQNPGITRRPWGYDVPPGDEWQIKLDKRLGIKR